MEQAAAILKLEKAALKWAKGEGCKAFRGPRVYLEEFREWWALNGGRYQDKGGLPTKDLLERELKQDELKRRRKQDEIDDGKWIPAKETHEEMRRLGIEQRSALQGKFEIELPPKLVGRDVITITERLKGAVDAICGIFERGVEPFAPAPAEWFPEI